MFFDILFLGGYMDIIKFRKLSKGRYKIYFDNREEQILYEEVILKFNLLVNKTIDDTNHKSIDDYNNECLVYHTALDSINNRFKSINDVRNLLLKKEFDKTNIDKAIKKLIDQGYLDDNLFTKNYINNQIFISNKGPYKIRKELIDHHVDLEIIDHNLELFTLDLQEPKIRKIINRFYNANKSMGGNVLKKKIEHNLNSLGYSYDAYKKIIEEFDFTNNKDLAKKEYEKLYRKLSKKYEGKELQYMIKNKLYQKGLYYED